MPSTAPTNPPPPAAGASTAPAVAFSAASPAPTGHNWRLANLTDTREHVIEAIQAAEFVPADMKTALVAAIQATHADARIIKVDVHCHLGAARSGKRIQSGHWCITEL